MGPYKLLIDGQLVDGDAVMPVINPATEEVLVECPRVMVEPHLVGPTHSQELASFLQGLQILLDL
jgi:acyl-CoA reductase-like NAD-dependent aldehyde dehydrogenase